MGGGQESYMSCLYGIFDHSIIIFFMISINFQKSADLVLNGRVGWVGGIRCLGPGPKKMCAFFFVAAPEKKCTQFRCRKMQSVEELYTLACF